MSEADNLSFQTAGPAFPQELFNLIVENVDSQTLANCALVNRTWGRRSQELLFRNVSLFTISNHWLQAFLRLLVDSPHIRLLIKGLTIFHLSVSRGQQQPAFDRDLGFVISRMTNLAHIYLQFEAAGGVRREDLPDFLTTTFSPALQQLQHLQSITFDSDGDLAENVFDTFRVCDGLTVGKIVISQRRGMFRAKPSATDSLLSFPNVTEVDFIGRSFDASLVHPWLSRPLMVFPRLRTVTFGAFETWTLNHIHLSLLLPKGLPGLRCIRMVWHASEQQAPIVPGSAKEETMPVLAIGTFPEVILDYRIDVYNDIAVLWWCRVFGHLETSIIESIRLVVDTTGEDLTNLEPWAKLDEILSSLRFRWLKELTVKFWVTPFRVPDTKRRNDGRIELRTLKFPKVAGKAKVRIFIESVAVPEPYCVLY